jgi:hypothetical protein
MIFFNKLFRLPGPVELGMSDHDAMPSEQFPGNNGDRPTWEDYDRRLKKDYPIRYFFAGTIGSFVMKYYWRVSRIVFKDPIYWLKCHILPSYKYHILDIRQPKKISGKDNPEHYSYGWLDSDMQMVFALFNILNNFVEKEITKGLLYCPTKEEIAKEPEQCRHNLQTQRDNYYEMITIYNWWNFERKEDLIKSDKLSTEWYNTKGTIPWDELNKQDERNEAKLNEMITRLLAIRKYLWT